MYKVKTSYSDSVNKKKLREFLINKFTFESVTGLAGPDINDYIQYLKSKGCKKFEIYENNPSIIVKQLSELNTPADISLKYGDILSADNSEPNTLYDLDFCSTIKNMKEYIKKFKNNFIMTFSMRFSMENTIKTFFSARDEEIISITEIFSPFHHNVFKTDRSEYLFATYKDSSTMCCFAKIN